MTLIDSNVLLDLVTEDPTWSDWSQRHATRGPLRINDVIYAEFSVGFLDIEDVEAVLTDAGIGLDAVPREALFLAGKVFQRYRARAEPRAACRRISLSARMPRSSGCPC